MEYFLTGGTGFVGGRLARQLLEDGHDVVALARDPSAAGDLVDAGATLVQGDITDQSSMCDAPDSGRPRYGRHAARASHQTDSRNGHEAARRYNPARAHSERLPSRTRHTRYP